MIARTALWHAVDRALARAQRLVVVTDAVSTCAPPRTTAAMPDDATVVFVLVPQDRDGDAATPNVINARVTAVQRRYPSSVIRLAGEMTREQWRRLGGRVRHRTADRKNEP